MGVGNVTFQVGEWSPIAYLTLQHTLESAATATSIVQYRVV